MSNESPVPTSQDVHAHLRAIAEVLRQPHRLDAAAQAALADLVDELDKVLEVGTIPNEETARLTATAFQFAEAVQREKEAGVLKNARDRFEEAAVAAESNAPRIAGFARQFLDALSNIGI